MHQDVGFLAHPWRSHRFWIEQDHRRIAGLEPKMKLRSPFITRLQPRDVEQDLEPGGLESILDQGANPVCVGQACNYG
jgi:hypothetical protein